MWVAASRGGHPYGWGHPRAGAFRQDAGHDPGGLAFSPRAARAARAAGPCEGHPRAATVQGHPVPAHARAGSGVRTRRPEGALAARSPSARTRRTPRVAGAGMAVAVRLRAATSMTQWRVLLPMRRGARAACPAAAARCRAVRRWTRHSACRLLAVRWRSRRVGLEALGPAGVQGLNSRDRSRARSALAHLATARADHGGGAGSGRASGGVETGWRCPVAVRRRAARRGSLGTPGGGLGEYFLSHLFLSLRLHQRGSRTMADRRDGRIFLVFIPVVPRYGRRTVTVCAATRRARAET